MMVGAGRAAESLHLPAAAMTAQVTTSVIADRNLERAREVARNYGVEQAVAGAEEGKAFADAAILALPHHLHARVARELLEAGLHVLVEKPLALTAAECAELGTIASERRLVLEVGMVRRRFPALRFVKRALERELLGGIRRVTLEEGMPFAWEVTSDFTFRRETGGGVLADSGIHVLDLLAWWFGELEPVAYSDDDMGGVEAESQFTLRLPSGAPVEVELSRTRELRNSIIIEGERGSLEAGLAFGGALRLDIGEAPLLIGQAQPHASEAGGDYQNVRELFIEQLENFRDSIRGTSSPLVDAKEAMVAVGLLERLRAMREPLELPWVTANTTRAA